ncbi:MAG: hypothetical protein AAB368_12535, partial [bacterium]
ETAASVFNPGANPHLYGTAGDPGVFLTRYRLYRIILRSGGPVQVFSGRNIMARYSGGSMLHASVPPGFQSGTQYWLHTGDAGHACGSPSYASTTIDVFCPRDNEQVRMEAATTGIAGNTVDTFYITNNIDQCVSFRKITPPAGPKLTNWRFTSVTGGDVMVQYIACNSAEKFYTAPFLKRNVYYDIYVPPVAYVGQYFWITIVVRDSGGLTKTNYVGTSSFTSTDSAAKLENQPMDTYNYTWTSGASKDNGVRLFIYVVMTQLGLQTIVASDIADGSITGLATVLIVGADVKLTKEPPLQVSASGDTVQFKICWSNYSTASAASFTISDQVPDGTIYVPDVLSNHFCGATKG